ncbi:hypothetical protein RRG08_064480 [Elysia crispata]|uniref:Uncharacterized protein n=1 Tax=Elysia crispata TaxID=231223 RepID=A0AAE1AFP9_9GAST|nr:hypothetical protein RRG08_064480 [Elysia crispata]
MSDNTIVYLQRFRVAVISHSHTRSGRGEIYRSILSKEDQSLLLALRLSEDCHLLNRCYNVHTNGATTSTLTVIQHPHQRCYNIHINAAATSTLTVLQHPHHRCYDIQTNAAATSTLTVLQHPHQRYYNIHINGAATSTSTVL